MKRIPLFGAGVKSYSEIVTSQRRVNCIYDIRKDEDKAKVVLLGTPGSTVALTLPTAPIRGGHVVGTTLYIVSGTTLYSVSAGGNYTTLGTLSTVARDVDMKDNGVDLTVIDGVTGYTCRLSTGVITQITDVNFPEGATSLAFINARYVINRPSSREYGVGALIDGQNWTPEIYGTKENSSDNLLAVDVLNGNVILWGELSMEFWQDVGASPNPFQRVSGATQSWGLAAVNSRAKINNTMMFLGINPDGGIKIMMLNGYTPVPVSDSDIDYIISNFTVYQDATALVYTAYGHAIYQLTFPTANRTLAYDTATSIWHEGQTGLDLVGRHFAKKGLMFNGKNYFWDATTGALYTLDEDVYTDNGTAIPREVCTRHIYSDGNEVFLSRLLLDIATGIGVASSVNPQVTLELSRDGGRTFGVEKTRALGAVGAFKVRADFNRLGSAKDFVARIRMTNPVKFYVTSGSADIEASNG